MPPDAGAPAARNGVCSRPAQPFLPPAAVSPAARRNGSCRPQQCLLPPSAAAPATRRSGACRGEQHLLPPGGAALAARRMSSCRPSTAAPVGSTRRLLPPAATSPAARRSDSCRLAHLPPCEAAPVARRNGSCRLGATTPAVVGGRPAKVCCRGHPTLQGLELLPRGHVSVDLLQLKGVHHGGCQVHQTNLGLLCLRNCCDSDHCPFLETCSFDAPLPPMCPPTGTRNLAPRTRVLSPHDVLTNTSTDVAFEPEAFPVGVVPHPP